jgi:hypothetical protein
MVAGHGRSVGTSGDIKVFCFFFSKKKTLSDEARYGSSLYFLGFIIFKNN